MTVPSGKLLAALATLVAAAAVGYFVWSGLKTTPLAAPADIVTTPSGWVKLDGGNFTVYAPQGAALRPAKDGGDITGLTLCIHYRTSPTAALAVTKTTHPDYKEANITIGGHPAVYRTAILEAPEQQAWFPDCGQTYYIGLEVPGALPGGASLVMDVSAGSEEELAHVVTMFKTVQFAK